MIMRVEDWNRRNCMCRAHGFRAAIVYEQLTNPYINRVGAPACAHRTKVKEYLYHRYGDPMCQTYSKTWINTESDWCCWRSRDDEYTIAVKDARMRDWLLLL